MAVALFWFWVAAAAGTLASPRMEVASASAFAGTRKATRSLPAAADETASDFWGGRRLRARGKASYGCEQERGKVRDWALTSNEKAAKRFRRFYKLFYVVDRLDETVGFWKDNSDASLQDRKSGYQVPVLCICQAIFKNLGARACTESDCCTPPLLEHGSDRDPAHWRASQVGRTIRALAYEPHVKPVEYSINEPHLGC